MYIYIRGIPCWSIWAITLTPVFHNSKILPLKQYFSAINYYHKHLYEKSGESAIAQIAYDGTPLIYTYIYSNLQFYMECYPKYHIQKKKIIRYRNFHSGCIRFN